MPTKKQLKTMFSKKNLTKAAMVANMEQRELVERVEADEKFVVLLEQTRTELHTRLGTKMCRELDLDCFDCKTRVLIGLINSWCSLLQPYA